MNWQELFTVYLPNIVFYASIISAGLPEPRPGSIGHILKSIINALAINIGAAKNRPPLPPTLIIGFMLIFALAQNAGADALTWTLPTERTNSVPYNAATENSAVKVYKDTGNAATGAVYVLPFNAVRYDIPPDCSGATFAWAVTAVDKTPPPIGPLESPLSEIVTTSIDKVGCKPKKLSVKLVTGS